jgi:hypothetical protein
MCTARTHNFMSRTREANYCDGFPLHACVFQNLLSDFNINITPIYQFHAQNTSEELSMMHLAVPKPKRVYYSACKSCTYNVPM